ncbi:MAG: sulfurtransferase-like selenium metabolism protein YedF [Bacteroidales bacterium]|jgi:selenium metabolism protein YedF|nr:sulfurtransferase-like selenium metabolism protein YedF [Bacteroidales bacterium]
MLIADTSGQLCPAPLIATKRALRETAQGESFQVITDNPASFSNISRFLNDNGIPFSFTELEGKWTLTVRKTGSAGENSDPSEYCSTDIPHFSKGSFIVVFSSDKMGEGDENLGCLLMRNFILAIKELDLLPAKMVFYNSGVHLVSDKSPVLSHLQELEKMGVTLLVCETCARHYSIVDKISAGILSNMFEIAQTMSSAGNIIKP